MARQEIPLYGYVASGDYTGYRIYHGSNFNWMSNCSDANAIGRNNLFLVWKQITHSPLMGFSYVPADNDELIPFGPSTIEKYKEIESGGGLFPTHNIMVKFKNGRKSVVALYNAGYQMFKGAMLNSMLDDF